MTAFKNTIVGRLLKGAAKVVLPVVGAITGIGAISGAAKGIGALAGIGGAVKDVGGVVGRVAGGVKKVIDKVSVGAINLATGTTQAERVEVRDQKAETKATADQWEQVDRLIKAGATRESAMATVGVSDVKVTGYAGVQSVPDNKLLIYAGLGLAALFIVPKLLKGR